jgi:hypothetical protein
MLLLGISIWDSRTSSGINFLVRALRHDEMRVAGIYPEQAGESGRIWGRQRARRSSSKSWDGSRRRSLSAVRGASWGRLTEEVLADGERRRARTVEEEGEQGRRLAGTGCCDQQGGGGRRD